MSKHDIHRCQVCGKPAYEGTMLDYNDKWFCGLPHKLKHERKENEEIHHRSNLLSLRPPGSG